MRVKLHFVDAPSIGPFAIFFFVLYIAREKGIRNRLKKNNVTLLTGGGLIGPTL
jgi:hypothetical protein